MKIIKQTTNEFGFPFIAYAPANEVTNPKNWIWCCSTATPKLSPMKI